MRLAHDDAYTSNTAPAPALPGTGALGLGLWFAAAVAFVGSGLFARAPAPVLPATLGGLTALALGAVLGSRDGRRWADALPLRSLALFHAWRLAPGAAFLVLYGQGKLPWGFAGPGGIGDVAVALTAPLAAWAIGRPTRAARAGYLVWSLAGFADLTNVVAHAFLLTRADPASMHLLRELPLGLLPAFAVPLTFVAHALAFRRLRAPR